MGYGKRRRKRQLAQPLFIGEEGGKKKIKLIE
jgi:hypothetical protein